MTYSDVNDLGRQRKGSEFKKNCPKYSSNSLHGILSMPDSPRSHNFITPMAKILVNRKEARSISSFVKIIERMIEVPFMLIANETFGGALYDETTVHLRIHEDQSRKVQKFIVML